MAAAARFDERLEANDRLVSRQRGLVEIGYAGFSKSERVSFAGVASASGTSFDDRDSLARSCVGCALDLAASPPISSSQRSTLNGGSGSRRRSVRSYAVAPIVRKRARSVQSRSSARASSLAFGSDRM